jgi:hypothetical protein
MAGKSLVAAAICLLGLAAGCSTGSTTGTITGVASPCVGLVTSAEYANLSVEVTLSNGSHVVASQAVKGKHVYRFTISPGTYVVSTKEGQGSTPVHVTLSSGQIARANIPSTCR